VVVDKYFSNLPCQQTPESTEKLVSGLREVCRNGAPVVAGVLTTQQNEDEYPRLEETISLDPVGQCNLRLGVVNTDPDTRRVPLNWWCRGSAKGSEVRAVPSLSLAAVEGAQPDIAVSDSRLAKLIQENLNPYTTVLPENEWGRYAISAGEVLCGRTIGRNDDWRACGDAPLSADLSSRLRGRVVLIGEDSPREDTHDTALGEMPGFVLQAGFIESLLDDRLYRPVPQAVNYGLGLLIFACFEYILEVSSSLWMAFRRMMFLILAAGGVIYVTVIHFGYFLNPAALSIAYLTIKISGVAVTRFGVGEHAPEVAGDEAKAVP
jgi:CHASE2 domain-containing sensor protein